jgi:hypothetical protein
LIDRFSNRVNVFLRELLLRGRDLIRGSISASGLHDRDIVLARIAPVSIVS